MLVVVTVVGRPSAEGVAEEDVALSVLAERALKGLAVELRSYPGVRIASNVDHELDPLGLKELGNPFERVVRMADRPNDGYCQRVPLDGDARFSGR